MKYLPLYLVILFLAGCASHLEEPEMEATEMDRAELVDVRINDKGEIRINNETVSESSLSAAIAALNTDETTRARFILHDNAYTGLVNKTVHQLHEKGVRNFTTKMLGPQEFAEYQQNSIHIDVLSSGMIMFRGQQLHLDDLPMALEASEFSKEKIVRLTVSPDAQYGMFTDVQEVLREKNILRIEYKNL